MSVVGRRFTDMHGCHVVLYCDDIVCILLFLFFGYATLSFGEYLFGFIFIISLWHCLLISFATQVLLGVFFGV